MSGLSISSLVTGAGAADPLAWRLICARRGVLVMAIVGAAAFWLTWHFFAPGYMSSDSAAQLEQARSMAFRDDHPIFMAVVWHYTDQILPGPLGLFALSTGLYWFGLSLLC